MGLLKTKNKRVKVRGRWLLLNLSGRRCDVVGDEWEKETPSTSLVVGGNKLQIYFLLVSIGQIWVIGDFNLYKQNNLYLSHAISTIHLQKIKKN